MTDKNKTAPAAATAETEKGKYTTDSITQAVQKIKVGATAKFKNRYAEAIAGAVLKILEEFCTQEEEFARAVMDGADVQTCIEAIADLIKKKQSVSDVEVFQHAAEFYFPGAVVECRMQIHMSAYDIGSSEPSASSKTIDLSLDSLIDW